MGRRPFALALAVLGALVLAQGVAAEPRELWPGVTFERGVQFTPSGPVALSILSGPRPGGTTTLVPLLSNETLTGRESLTAMQRRLASTATTAGVNGDYFTLATGRPSGVLMRGGQLISPPRTARSSAGITSDGRLDVRRVGFFGSWVGAGPRRPLSTVNDVPADGQSGLFTDAYGALTPLVPGAIAAILFPFPLAQPGADLVATVVEIRPSGAPIEIPRGGAVLVARGLQASALGAEAIPGETVTVRLQLRPDWPGVTDAIGGGPQIVRDGVPVFRAGEEFTSAQLAPRAPRTAVGQTADGRVLLVTVDGRQPGFSVGLTNFELAQALVRLGAVTGMALDGGGSTTMAFDGLLLNRPSDGRERPIATALVLAYSGVFVPDVPARVSPNGDGVDDAPALAVRVVRPSTVTTRLVAPGGAVVSEETEERAPGTVSVPFPAAPRTAAAGAAGIAKPSIGRWRLEVTATDDVGRITSMRRGFVVDDTLGFLRAPRVHAVRSKGRPLTVSFRLTRTARVQLEALDGSGRLVRRTVARRLGAGAQQLTWDGLGPARRVLPSGRYTVRVAAIGPVGRSELDVAVVLRVLAGAGQ